MTLDLSWMRPDAPYMPIVTVGLFAILEEAGIPAHARWTDVLEIDANVSAEHAAELIASAPLPDVNAIPWPSRGKQAVKSSLKGSKDALGTFRDLVDVSGPAERRLLLALATDQVVDGERLPGRSRLLRGAKADLSAYRNEPALAPDKLYNELLFGPQFAPGKSGRALGLVPEVQTFGGTVGRDASTLGAESDLLSRLLRHGVLALPPIGVAQPGRRPVGGPLITDDSYISWPTWAISCGLRELRTIFSFAELHASEPNATVLRARGITRVYRSALQQLSTTVSVFRWGRRVA